MISPQFPPIARCLNGADLPLLSRSWAFLRTRKKLWMPPIVAMLVIVLSLFVVAKVATVVPYIYALF